MTVEFDKRPNLYVLQFVFEGTVRTTCDRCLADIDLPVTGDHQLMVKLEEERTDKDEDDPDVVFVQPDLQKLELASYIYEFLHLAIPMIKVYDCEEEAEPSCDFDMLDRLDDQYEEAAEDEPADNPIWSELKKLNKNQ